MALMAPNMVTISQTTFLGNAAGFLGGAIALLGSVGENYVNVEGSTFMANQADVGADVAISSPSTVVADFGPDAVLVEPSAGYQWSPLSSAEAQVDAQEQAKPLLSGDEAWITSADRVRGHCTLMTAALPPAAGCAGPSHPPSLCVRVHTTTEGLPMCRSSHLAASRQTQSGMAALPAPATPGATPPSSSCPASRSPCSCACAGHAAGGRC